MEWVFVALVACLFALMVVHCLRLVLEDWASRRRKLPKSGFSAKQYDELVNIIHREFCREFSQVEACKTGEEAKIAQQELKAAQQELQTTKALSQSLAARMSLAHSKLVQFYDVFDQSLPWAQETKLLSAILMLLQPEINIAAINVKCKLSPARTKELRYVLSKSNLQYSKNKQ